MQKQFGQKLHIGNPNGQYLGKDDYREAIRRMRFDASDLNTPTPWATRADPNGFSFEVKGLQLNFTMPDLYLKSVSATGKRYVLGGTQPKSLDPDVVQMEFGETYMNLGWIKTERNLPVTLKSLNEAMATFSGGSPGKNEFLQVIVAFAEGLRFDAVVQKIIGENPITKLDVSWDDHRATVRKGT